MIQAQPTSTPTPTEPFGEVICQYRDTLFATQKQTNLTNSLLHDITIFNDHDSSKLEECLTDVETAADLTDEGQTELPKAKSRGLTHTPVTEAINLDKSWNDIKDLLRLKLCNANIHTYTSCFMDIQQQKSKLLAAYIHTFKTEAKQCEFTNDAATIRIFIKGLKDAPSLATRIYEKYPHTLTDTIREVGKFHKVQELTATIIPSSIVNIMLNEED